MGKCYSKPRDEEEERKKEEKIQMVSEEYKYFKQIKSYKLTSQAKKMISKAFSRNPLFRGLNSSDYEFIFHEVNLYAVNSNIVLFEQGSIGSLFFIIHTGRVEVVVNGKSKGILSREKCFGEMALLSDSRRKASIKTITNCSFFILSSAQFYSTMKTLFTRQYDKIREIVSNVHFFSSSSEKQKTQIAKLSIYYLFKSGDTIIYEGDEGNLLYILKSGAVAFKRNKDILNKVSVPGEMFGEGAMLTGKNRRVSAIAVGETELISIDQGSMVKVFGENFKEILLKNTALHSILSDSHLSFLNKNDIITMCTKLRWTTYENYSVVIPSSYVKLSKLKIICDGTVVSTGADNSRLGAYQVIGLNNNNEKKLNKCDYISEGHTIVGELDRGEIEELLQINIEALFDKLDKVRFLKSVGIFSEISLSSIKKVSESMTYEKYKKGVVIFKKGAKSDTLYIVTSGEVNITKDDKLIRVVSKNETFGERCLMEKYRSASAKASKPLEAYLISKNVIERLPEIDLVLMKVLGKSSYQSEIDFDSLYIIEDYPSVIGRRKYCVKHKQKEHKTLYDLMVIPLVSLESLAACYSLVKEKNIWLQIECELIIKLVCTSVDESNVYFVSEHVPSLELTEILPISRQSARHLITHLLTSLKYLHEKEIAHRNINISNIVVNTEGLAYLKDFSCATLCPNRTYTRIGLPFHRSPEMILGRGYTKANDFWSIGIILYQIIYGTWPFAIEDSDAPLAIYEKILHNKPGVSSNEEMESVNELILNLLVEEEKRYDFDAIKNCRWMSHLDWHLISSLKINLPAKSPSGRSQKKEGGTNTRIRSIRELKPVRKYLECSCRSK